MLDSGASDHIVDKNDSMPTKELERTDVWMDTVGSEQHITDLATTAVPYFEHSEIKALAIPNSANCASMGRTVNVNRARFIPVGVEGEEADVLQGGPRIRTDSSWTGGPHLRGSGNVRDSDQQ